MLEVGSLVDGKYKILNEIGRGGMSVVYLALNERANKTWAIKEVRKDGGNDTTVVSQGLVAETEMLKKLSHPNLPSIIDVIDQETVCSTCSIRAERSIRTRSLSGQSRCVMCLAIFTAGVLPSSTGI